MKYILLKDRRRRVLFFAFERKRRVLQSLYKDSRLTSAFRQYLFNCIRNLPRDSSVTRFRNRCILTNRPRGVYRAFGRSRRMFRQNASQGKLLGLHKASW